LNAEDFKAVQKIEKHTMNVTVLTTSPDGTKVVSGDGYRYQIIWDASTKA
jgi:hypothetical protein